MRSLIFRFRLEIWQIWGHFTCAGITFKRSVSFILISTSFNKVNALLTKIDDYIKKSVICAHSCFISLKTLFCVASPWTDHKTFKIKITMFMLERRNIERRSWIFVSHSLMKVCRISRDLTCLKRSVSTIFSDATLLCHLPVMKLQTSQVGREKISKIMSTLPINFKLDIWSNVYNDWFIWLIALFNSFLMSGSSRDHLSSVNISWPGW